MVFAVKSHIQLNVFQNPQSLFCKSAPQTISHSLCSFQGFFIPSLLYCISYSKDTAVFAWGMFCSSLIDRLLDLYVNKMFSPQAVTWFPDEDQTAVLLLGGEYCRVPHAPTYSFCHRVSSLHFCGGEQHNIYLKDGPVARALGLIWSVTVGAGRCVFFFPFFSFFMLGWDRTGETKTKTKTFPPPPLPTTKSAFPSVVTPGL